MGIEFIPAVRWREFLASFTRAHRGWLVTLEMTASGRQPVRLMRDVPLVGVFDDPDRLVIATGRGRQRVGRVVERPVALGRPHAADADLGLEIETDAGDHVHLRFRSAIPSVCVDGAYADGL